MWPFSSNAEPRAKSVNYRSLDANFAVTGQILPEQVAAVAEAGFKTIVCARPDNEDPGQPSFADVSREAEKAGLKTIHVPVSGALTQSAFIRFERAMKELPKPVLAYCRSGGRAASLYGMLKQN